MSCLCHILFSDYGSGMLKFEANLVMSYKKTSYKIFQQIPVCIYSRDKASKVDLTQIN